ncbi:MAG: hypothetical protein HYT63_02300 [Candidatus Yanofskybacteria bacterium]|nr:hypothetical protein [Candidatus Yanofskybacteria bacterium]
MKEKKFVAISGSKDMTSQEKKTRTKAFEQFQSENRELLSKRGVNFLDFSSRRLLYEVYSKYVQGEREFKNPDEKDLYEKIKDLLDTGGGDLAA